MLVIFHIISNYFHNVDHFIWLDLQQKLGSGLSLVYVATELYSYNITHCFF